MVDCAQLLSELCELVEEIPLMEFHGAVKARVYKCGTKCIRIDPEVPEEDYDEYIYEVECP